jgi:signal transduction histidine kinase/CheY-like chemotaxis protein
MDVASWYDPSLVLLSVAVSIAASFTSLSLADRLQNSQGRGRVAWLLGAAASMGGGIWAMHFVAMLAFHLDAPVEYHVGLTVLSMAVAVAVVGIGFAIVTYKGVGFKQLLAGGLFMGLGVATMHYIGMAAMQMAVHISYDPTLFVLSIVIAVVASIAALWLSFNTPSIAKKLGAAVVMGAAVCGMHYTGMAAASYEAMAHAAHSEVPGMSPALLALAIGVTTFGVLFIGIGSAIVDQRFATKAREANARLMAEVAERARAQDELKAAHGNLERTVEERTRDLRAALAAAEAANEAKSLFVASMSHELRTPLNAIIGYSEMLMEDAEAEDRHEQTVDLERITAAGRHLLRLINDVLDLSRIEAGRLELQIETFSIDAIVSEVAATCEPLVAKNGNRMIVRRPELLGEMQGDATKLRQCALNLLSNAAKFTENGEVSFEARREATEQGEELVLVVRDNGIGIAQEHLSRLFHNFSQADSSIGGKYGGAGLGLSLSQRLCRLMGGRIAVESEAGVGSTFTIRVPTQAAGAAAAAPPPLRAREGAAASAGAVALVIDDDPAVRDLAERFLTKEGYRSVLAATAEQGLDLAREMRPDVIILDVLLPGRDGFEALRRLKDDPELRDIPVVMLTMLDDKRRALALGAADFLVKPVERLTLVEAVNRSRRAA